jgi:hypothetical protein
MHKTGWSLQVSSMVARDLSDRKEGVKDTSECQKPMISVRGTRLLSCQASWELQRVAGGVHRAKEAGNAAVGRELVILPWHNLGCARTGLIGVLAADPGSSVLLAWNMGSDVSVGRSYDVLLTCQVTTTDCSFFSRSRQHHAFIVSLEPLTISSTQSAQCALCALA